MKDIFDRLVADEVIGRLGKLSADTIPEWGKMDAGQMTAHCCVPYETIFEPAYLAANPKPGAVFRTLQRLVIKGFVTGPKPYKRNGRTAPSFVITGQRDFKVERDRLIGYINRAQEMGRAQFEGKESHSFGPLTADEWNVLFYKHVDHHLTQFGV